MAQLTAWDCPPCAKAGAAARTTVLDNSTSGMQGYVADMKGGDIVVAFRGSSDVMNWIDDFEFIPQVGVGVEKVWVCGR